jgi:hypothetical protein
LLIVLRFAPQEERTDLANVIEEGAGARLLVEKIDATLNFLAICRRAGTVRVKGD